MDDILSAALCEAGLEEFLVCQPSPVPSTSESVTEDTNGSLSNPSTSISTEPLKKYPNNLIPDPLADYDDQEEDSKPNNSSVNVENAIAPEIPQVQLIPRKRPPDVIKPKEAEKEMEPLNVKIDGVNRRSSEQFDNSCSPSPRVVNNNSVTAQRSMTASPASTISNSSGGGALQMQNNNSGTSLVTNASKASPGPIIRRTVHTRNGIQTQYLKPYINDQGQKIYRAVNSIPPAASVSVATNRGGLAFRGSGRGGVVTGVRPNERIVMVRQEGPNGQVVMKKVIGTSLISGSSTTPTTTMTPMYNGTRGTTVVGRAAVGRGGNLIIRSRGGGAYTSAGYRVTNIVGRGTGGSTMIHHQPTTGTTRIARAGGMTGRVVNRGGGVGAVRYTTTIQSTPREYEHRDRSYLHVSTSSPSFQYVDHESTVLSTSPYPKVAGRMVAGSTPRTISQLRGGMVNRVSNNNGLVRLSTGGYDQTDHGRMGLQNRLMLASPSSPMIGGLGGGNNGSGVGLQQQQQSSGQQSNSNLLVVQTKSQKAKDEMKMAYQMGKEEALLQRRNDLEDDEENLGYAETYAEYTPAKLRSGTAHPDSVVESASLSSVSPPDVKYLPSIPEYLIDMGNISALQLEAVIYACQMHEKRMPSGERYGYLIGDGAGVGKGRTVACIIFENYLQGRKRAIWLSVSSDLKFDAERDLRDVGAPNIAVHALNKMKYAKISSKENGSIKKGVIFATYTSLIGECRGAKSRKYRSRIKQLIQWFGQDYDGVIILDECHRAKNLVPTAGAKPTKTGRMVLELQSQLPNARVVYASATGATEPRNMAYMTRLGLWGERQAFPKFGDFIQAVERRGVGAMEIVAMDMKQRGLYLARQLSFRGVSFSVQEVQLSSEFVKMYDDAVKLWMEARRQFQVVLENMDEEERATCKTVWGQFWACHQRFFKYLCIAAKVDTCVRLTREAIKSKKCVVIGLQSTGESATLETLEEQGGELNEFVSTAKTVLYGLIDKHFPTETGSGRDIFDDFETGKPAKRRKNNDTLSFLNDASFGSWSGASVGMSGWAGQKPMMGKKSEEDANSTTSESSSEESDGEEKNDDKGWDSAREEAEGARTLDDCEEDEWVKQLLAEAESSSDSEDEGGEDSNHAPIAADNEEEEEDDDDDVKVKVEENDEEFNPFMCDFTNDDPWAKQQQIVEDTPEKKEKPNGKKRKRVEENNAETEELKERRKKREERREKKLRREARRAEREKARRMEAIRTRGNANDFITSSRFCGAGEEDKTNINPMLIKTELLAAVERLAPSLPANTLDQLIDELGGPEFVAEMTGRRGHMITNETGDVVYQRRNKNAEVSLELINMEEKEKFMRGEKLIAIISEAASSGISLQSDRRALNTRRRVHITLELPWSADKAIQQFGRTHRSNQVSGPEYVFLISELAGEKRFASVVAKRLESLGALTHGDRRATETRDLSQFNMDNKYGRVALDILLKTVIGQSSPPLIDPPKDYKAGDFFEDMRLYMEGVGLLTKNKNNQYTIEKDAATISKFLNRILGLPVHAQNALFHYFSEIVAELIAQSKHDGTYDSGIMDLGTGDDQVRKLETRIFLGRVDNGSFRVEMHKIGVERGVSWEEAFGLYKEHNSDEDGFYICHPPASGNARKVAALVYGIGKVRLDNGARLYAITRPSTGRSPKLMTMSDLTKRFQKASSVEEAKECWESQFEAAANMCQHKYVHGKCKIETSGTYCEVGRRTRTYFVLSGSVLSVWPTVEEVLASIDRKSSRMQIIRVRTEQDQKIVGLLILPTHVRILVQQLEAHCGRSIVKTDDN